MPLLSVNPATGKTLRAYPEMAPDEVDAILRGAREAFAVWRQRTFEERGDCLRRVASLLRVRKHRYAAFMAEEMGKPVKGGDAEIEKCAWVCEHFAHHAEEYLKPLMVESEARRSYVTYAPLGVVLAIMPWNFPFWQVFRCAAQALMAGNTVVLKHANNVTGCALAIEELFQEAELPANVFRALVVDVPRMPGIIAHECVAIVTLTGSTRAGRAVASQAGTALKKVVLELGGSDPFLVLEDADLEAAVKAGVISRMMSSGQSCIAAKRFIVVNSVREAFTDMFLQKMRRVRVGDPMLPDTDVGPLARLDLRETLHQQVVDSVEKGARLLLGGEIPQGPGAFYPPTVLDWIEPGMPLYEEEVFGPVAAIIPAKDEAEAITIANDTPYGLGAAVFTKDIERGEAIAAYQLEAGSCFVNDFVKSDPRLPFGGIKASGYGRELGRHGIHELVNVKTVYVG